MRKLLLPQVFCTLILTTSMNFKREHFMQHSPSATTLFRTSSFGGSSCLCLWATLHSLPQTGALCAKPTVLLTCFFTGVLGRKMANRLHKLLLLLFNRSISSCPSCISRKAFKLRIAKKIRGSFQKPLKYLGNLSPYPQNITEWFLRYPKRSSWP